MKFLPLLLVTVALTLTAGCKPKAKDIPPLQRKQAANLVSEGQFALTLRDFARAEPLFEQAARLCPDNGDYWVNLGVARRRQGNKSGAKAAYEQARAAYRDAFEIDPRQSDALLQEVYTLALLGRPDDARKALAKAQQRLPDNRGIKGFAETKQLDRLLEDPGFKEIAL
jgi:tetratricopeptide (TPR) repeat protein